MRLIVVRMTGASSALIACLIFTWWFWKSSFRWRWISWSLRSNGFMQNFLTMMSAATSYMFCMPTWILLLHLTRTMLQWQTTRWFRLGMRRLFPLYFVCVVWTNRRPRWWHLLTLSMLIILQCDTTWRHRSVLFVAHWRQWFSLSKLLILMLGIRKQLFSMILLVLDRNLIMWMNVLSIHWVLLLLVLRIHMKALVMI